MKTDVMTGEVCEEMCAARDAVKAEVSIEKCNGRKTVS